MKKISTSARIVPVVAAAVLGLSACTPVGGIAAEVGGQKIQTSDVDLLATITCDQAASSTQPGSTAQPVSVVREQSLTALVTDALSHQLGDRDHATYDRAKLLSAMTGIDDQLTAIPEADRARVRDLVEQFNIGQLELIDLGRKQLVAAGTASPSDSDALNAGYALMTKYADSIKIKIDPRFAPSGNNPGRGVRSLSKAVSDYAKQSDSTSPRPSWAMALPADQKCG